MGARQAPAKLPGMLNQFKSLARVDFAPGHRQPAVLRVLLASLTAIAGSLLADAAIVAISQAAMPSTKGYVHFQFPDYGKLTVIGVVIACIAWPITTRISSDPRWMFFRMAIAVTLVLLLPDLYILSKGQPAQAVAALMVMHVAIGAATYTALVRLAPTRPDATAHDAASRPVAARGPVT